MKEEIRKELEKLKQEFDCDYHRIYKENENFICFEIDENENFDLSMYLIFNKKFVYAHSKKHFARCLKKSENVNSYITK